MDWTIRARARDFLPSAQAGCGADTVSCAVSTEALSLGYSDWGTKPTTHLHLVSSLRVSGAIPLLPLYAFMACTGQTVPFYFVTSTGFFQTPVPVSVKMFSVSNFPLNFFMTVVNSFYVNSNVDSSNSLFVNYYTHRISRLLGSVVCNETTIHILTISSSISQVKFSFET